MTADAVLLFARVVVVATFGASALAKARDLDGFHGTLVAFRVAGDARARRLAPLVLAAEVVAVALSLAPPPVAYAGLGLAAALLVAYTVLLASTRAHGTTVGCHCFGRRPQPLSWWDVGRNAVLLAAVTAGLASGGTGTPADLAPAAAAVALVLLAVHLGPVADALRAPLPVEETP